MSGELNPANKPPLVNYTGEELTTVWKNGAQYRASFKDLSQVPVSNRTESFVASPGDQGLLIAISNAAARTVTLPRNSPVGTNIAVCRKGLGAVSFVAGSGATLVSPGGFVAAALQYSVITAICIEQNAFGTGAVWLLGGDLT